MLLLSTRMPELGLLPELSLMRKASPAPPDRWFPVKLTFWTPPKMRKSAEAAKVEPLTVLLLKVELTTLNRKAARPLSTTSLFEKVMADCEPGTVALRFSAASSWPSKRLASIRTLVNAPPATYSSE